MAANCMSRKPKYLPEDRIISDEDYAKLKFQLRTQINAILQMFNCYGLGDYIPGAVEELTTLAENFGQAVRGDNHKPIHVVTKPKLKAIE
jgi:hypothetical protein